MKNILTYPNTSIRGNVKEVAVREQTHEANIYGVMDRLRYGPYWRNKKAEVEQSIYKATLSNDQSSR